MWWEELGAQGRPGVGSALTTHGAGPGTVLTGWLCWGQDLVLRA